MSNWPSDLRMKGRNTKCHWFTITMTNVSGNEKQLWLCWCHMLHSINIHVWIENKVRVSKIQNILTLINLMLLIFLFKIALEMLFELKMCTKYQQRISTLHLFSPLFLGGGEGRRGKQWSFLNSLIEPRVDNGGYHKKI